jgi:hypothetical protein
MVPPDTPETGQAVARTVTCPTCTGPSLFSPDNRFRPFCSERCRRVDLGAWASESFRMPDPEAAPAQETGIH